MSGAGGVEGVGPLDTDDQLFSEAGTGRGGFDGLQGGTDAERAAYAEAQASGETASICSEEEACRGACMSRALQGLRATCQGLSRSSGLSCLPVRAA